MKIFSIIGWIVAIALVIYCVNSCNKDAKAIQIAQDSLNIHKKITDSIKRDKDYLLSANEVLIITNHNDSARYARTNDSLKTVIAILKGKFSITKDSINTLYAQLKTFYLAGDTNSLKIAYLELRKELDEAGSQLFQIQIARDSADYAKDNEIDRLNGTIKTLQGQLDRAFVDLTTQIANSRAEENATKKLINRQKRAKLFNIFENIFAGIAGIFIGSKH